MIESIGKVVVRSKYLLTFGGEVSTYLPEIDPEVSTYSENEKPHCLHGYFSDNHVSSGVLLTLIKFYESISIKIS